MRKYGYVYILASKSNGTLYIGVTSDIERRDWEHKTKEKEGFTARYNVNRLVYVEVHDCISDAIAREKAMKKWRRAWKIELIEEANPDWRDLSSEL
jgi:putative endonuclease